MKKKLPVRWDKKATASLKDIHDYITKDSKNAAKYVKNEILKITATLNEFPEKYVREPFLTDSPKNFRFINKWHYKIIYEVNDNEIIIIDLFHTSQHPSKIQKPD